MGLVPVGNSVHPCSLGVRMLRQLALVEDGFAALAVPLYLHFLIVLDRQTQCRHVGTIDDDTVIRRVLCPSSSRTVVGPPGPDIVENNVVAIHFRSEEHTSELQSRQYL